MMKKLFITQDLASYADRGELVVPEIARAAPVTVSLVCGAAIIWVVVSIVMGTLAAALKGSWIDRTLMMLGLIGISIPVFWLGQVANLITQNRYHDTWLFSWVPALGYVPLTQNPWGWFKALVIPWVVLAVLFIGVYSRVLRADLVALSGEDFIRTARAKGLSPSRILIRHGLRTAMVTFVSLFGMDFAQLVGGGALLTEVVFGLPGVGRLTYQALTNLDRSRQEISCWKKGYKRCCLLLMQVTPMSCLRCMMVKDGVVCGALPCRPNVHRMNMRFG